LLHPGGSLARMRPRPRPPKHIQHHYTHRPLQQLGRYLQEVLHLLPAVLLRRPATAEVTGILDDEVGLHDGWDWDQEARTLGLGLELRLGWG